MSEEMKLSRKDLQECLNNLESEKFLDAFCIIDWVNKTEKENKELQQRIDKAIGFIQNGRDGKGQSYVDFVRYVSIDDDKKILDILQGKEVK